MFYSVDILRTSSPRDNISNNPEPNPALKRKEDARNIGVFATKSGSQNIEIVLLIKENQVAKVKEFSAFLCIGRCKSLDLSKSFL